MPAPASPVLLAQATDDGGGSVRQIAPDVVAPLAVDPGTLEREAPREPLGDLGTAGPPKPKPAEEGEPRIFRPVALAAGRIQTNGVTIVLSGIEILEPAQTCRGVNGDWPCGMAARTAFRSFLRGRALDCDLPEGELPERLTAACRLGTQDLGAWLVVNGWAKVSSTGPYAAEQARAIEEKKGMFGPGPAALPESSVPSAGAAPVEAEGAQVPAADLPAEEPAEPAIERQPLPEPKGLY
jgi:endonuclease YncB( thermonuclease family)